MKKFAVLLALAALLAVPGSVVAQPPGDGCTYTASYWAANPDQWPVDELVVGQVLLSKPELLALLDARGNGADLSSLTRETIAAKLNVANGGPTSIEPYITWADLILVSGKSNDRRFRNLRSMSVINNVRKTLAAYNALGCDAAAGAAALL